MLSVAGIYDGKSILPTEAILERRKYKVIITFVEEIDGADNEHADIRNFGTGAFALQSWHDPKEDIYQDYLNKKAPE